MHSREVKIPESNHLRPLAGSTSMSAKSLANLFRQEITKNVRHGTLERFPGENLAGISRCVNTLDGDSCSCVHLLQNDFTYACTAAQGAELIDSDHNNSPLSNGSLLSHASCGKLGKYQPRICEISLETIATQRRNSVLPLPASFILLLQHKHTTPAAPPSTGFLPQQL